MEVTHLPPGPEPKPISARHAARDFHDRLSAFMAANNVNGFVIEDIPEDGPIMQFLLAFEQRNQMDYDKFKREAHKLKDLTNRSVKQSHCLELLAAVWGYRTLAALQARKVCGTVYKKGNA